MEAPLKKLSVIAAERGLTVKMLRKAIRERQLKAHRPGGGKHTWHYVTDFQVDAWLGRRSTC
jgi:hypothetical protein